MINVQLPVDIVVRLLIVHVDFMTIVVDMNGDLLPEGVDAH